MKRTQLAPARTEKCLHARARRIAIVGILLGASLSASAQFGGGMPGGGMPAGGMPGKSGSQGGRSIRGGDETRPAPPQVLPVSSLVQARLADLRSDLSIDETQRLAWDRYAQSVLRLMNDIIRVDETPLPLDMTAPKRLEHLADVARNRVTATEDVVEAGNSLYAMLSPTQRAIADRKLAAVAMPLFGMAVTGDLSALRDQGRTPATDAQVNARGAPPSRP